MFTILWAYILNLFLNFQYSKVIQEQIKDIILYMEQLILRKHLRPSFFSKIDTLHFYLELILREYIK